MRVKLDQDWRRWKAGRELTGGAARLALAEKAGKEIKKRAPKTRDSDKGEVEHGSTASSSAP